MGNQEERTIQAWWHAELEVEEEACLCSKEGHQPIHQGTLCLQGQASFKDGEGTCPEEIEGGLELNFQMISTQEALVGGLAELSPQPLVQTAWLWSLGCTVRHF